jgi:hypothetical protein
MTITIPAGRAGHDQPGMREDAGVDIVRNPEKLRRLTPPAP